MTPRAIPRSRSASALLRLAAGAAVGLAACNDATAPLPSDGPPRELTFSKGGFVNVLYDARLAGDTVVVTAITSGTSINSGPRSIVTRRVPSGDDWRAFWRTVNDAGVRRWPGECRDASGLDGGEFTFTLAWAGGRRSGTYVNVVPTRRGTCTRDDVPSGDATRFQHAVLTLAGLSVYESFGGA